MDSRSRASPANQSDLDTSHWVLHVPFRARDLSAAIMLAEDLTRRLAGEVQVGSAEVSAEDRQSRRYRVWCDRRLPGTHNVPRSGRGVGNVTGTMTIVVEHRCGTMEA